jgi:hypothetical protein
MIPLTRKSRRHLAEGTKAGRAVVKETKKRASAR